MMTEVHTRQPASPFNDDSARIRPPSPRHTDEMPTVEGKPDVLEHLEHREEVVTKREEARDKSPSLLDAADLLGQLAMFATTREPEQVGGMTRAFEQKKPKPGRKPGRKPKSELPPPIPPPASQHESDDQEFDDTLGIRPRKAAVRAIRHLKEVVAAENEPVTKREIVLEQMEEVPYPKIDKLQEEQEEASESEEYADDGELEDEELEEDESYDGDDRVRPRRPKPLKEPGQPIQELHGTPEVLEDGTINDRGYPICGVVNQRGKLCQRIGTYGGGGDDV